MSNSLTFYKELTDSMLSKLRSSGYGNIAEAELDDMLSDFIRPAIIKFKACKQDLSNRDDVLKTFNFRLTDEEFEILSNFMLIDFLTVNYINVPSLLRQSLPSKDFNVFSSANHLKALLELRESYKKETRQMISIYSNSDSDLFAQLNIAAAHSRDFSRE